MSVDYRLQIVREMENGHFESVGYVHGGILCVLPVASSLRLPLFSLALKLADYSQRCLCQGSHSRKSQSEDLVLEHAHSLVTGNWTTKHLV
jgi:hypothetical protein